MWIRMLDTYSGSAGLFLKNTRYEVPDDLLKLLPKGSYEKTCPPWDDHVDKQAVELTAAQNAANDLQARAELLAANAEKLKQKADSLVAGVSEKQADNRKAEQLANQGIIRSEKAAENAKKAPSEDNQRKAAKLEANAQRLARENERKSAEFHLAHSEFAAILARGELKRLDAEEAERAANAAARALERLKEKFAKAKTKETDDAKSETGQPIDQSIDQSIDEAVEGKGAQPVAEGQAVPSGQAGQ